MPAAQAMAADKVASVSRGVREVSISAVPPAAAAAAAVAAAPAASRGGVEESKDRPEEPSCAGGDEGEDDIDENDPLWKVSRWCFFLE